MGGLTMQNHAACTVHFQTPTCHNKKKPAAAQSFGVIYSSSVPHLGWDGCHPGQRQTWLGFGPTRGSRGAKHPGIVVENP